MIQLRIETACIYNDDEANCFLWEELDPVWPYRNYTPKILWVIA